jgi:hypothetical protein
MATAIAVRNDEAIYDTHMRVIEYYREALEGKKAEIRDSKYPPIFIGPTWQISDNGYWVLPEHSLGWDVIGWSGTWLQHRKDEPWRFTLEQARLMLWWFALNELGQFIYADAVIQRLKGWGKDPFGACWLADELLGPCRFLEWDRGEPIAKDMPEAWCQTAAVSLEQTRNTMRLFPNLFSAAAKAKFDLRPGKEFVYALGDSRFIQAHTSSPTTMEGNRVTATLMNEPQHWLEANDGHEMAAVIRRNSAKAPDGSSRSMRITNAYEPGLDSVGERDREAYEKMIAGEVETTGLLYDSVEAPADAPLTAEAALEVVPAIRGDSTWLQPRSIVREILDIRNKPSQSRRFWFNQIWAAEDAWTIPSKWDLLADRTRKLEEGDALVLFGDGSKNDDATSLHYCRLSDGHTGTFGIWQRPQGVKEWSVPRGDVDDIVVRVHAHYKVKAFFFDPGEMEDETGASYWDSYIDDWSNRFGGGYDIWAVEGGAERNAVKWDMRSPARLKVFTEACERVLGEIDSKGFTQDGNATVRMHVGNARRRPNQFGVSIGKESRESARKIDAAVTLIGARMLRRIWIALPDRKKKRDKTGRARFL